MQIPPIVSALIFLNVGVLVIPEIAWERMGVDVLSTWDGISGFLQHQLSAMEHKNAAYVFWLLIPFVSSINTLVMLIRYNTCGFSAYLMRREKALRDGGEGAVKNRRGIVVGGSVLIAGFSFALFYGRYELVFLPDNFLTTNNRLSLVVIHGFVFLYVFPMVITAIVTEIRAGRVQSKYMENEQ